MLTDRLKYSFSIAALLVSCFFVLSACENDQRELDQVFQKKTGVEVANQVESYLSQNGVVKAKLTAPYMLRYQTDSPYTEFPHSLHVDFYNDSAQVESTVDAKYGKYIEFNKKVLLRDSVLVISLRNGDTLRTQELWWDQNKQEFFTDKPAHVHQPDKVIFAKSGLRASQNLTHYVFYGSSGQLQVPQSDIPN